MLRVTRILLLVLLVGAQVGSTTLLLTAPCETCQECCAPGDTGGTDCLLCAACCAGVAGNVVAPLILPAPMPLAGVMPMGGALLLPPRLSEILHIPEFTLV